MNLLREGRGGACAHAAGLQGVALSPTSDILYMSIRQRSHIKRVYVSGASGSQTSDAELIAGSRFGSVGSTDGVGTRAKFKRPEDVAMANDGRALFVADTGNHVVISCLSNALSQHIVFTARTFLTKSSPPPVSPFSDSQNSFDAGGRARAVRNIVTWPGRPVRLH